jgi:hypothetical protein
MSHPIDPTDHFKKLPPESAGSLPATGSDPSFMSPTGPALSPDNPMVQLYAKFFNVPPAEMAIYAQKIFDSLCQGINHEIQRMRKKAKQAAEEMKKAIRGEL